MGTSAFDLINKGVGSNTTPGSKPLSAFDVLQKKPDQNVINNFGGDDDTHENDGTFTHTLSSFVNYLGTLHDNTKNLIPGVSQGFSMDRLQVKPDPNDPTQDNHGAALQQTFNNIKSDIGNAINYYKTTPIAKIANDAVDMASSSLSGSPGSISGGLLKGFIEKPIEALTSTVNDSGTARPANIQEQSANLQSVAGLVAQLGTFKALKAGFMGEMPTSVDAATNALQGTQLGKLAISGGIKQGAKFIGSEAATGGISGGVGGAISGIGQDDQATQIISGALSFLPLTTALGVFGVKGYLNDLKETKSSLQAAETIKSTPEIAAVNALRIDPSDPISTLVKNTSLATSSDHVVKVAISSRLAVGDGYIVEDVSKALGDQLVSGAMPSAALYPDHYVPPVELAKPRPRPNSTEVKFDSPFDKLAYLAANPKRTPYVSALLDHAIEQTGLSRDEIISHGQYVRQQQKVAFRQGKLIPRTQAEIDAYNQASVENGKAIVAKTIDGSQVKDSNDQVWTRTGNSFQNGDGSQVLPADQTNTLQILGRKKADTPFYQPFQQLPKQTFNPNFGRVETGIPNVKYHYSNNGTLLVTPTNYTPDALDFFKRTGFMKGEIVVKDGMDASIVGRDDYGLLVKTVNNGQITSVVPDGLRRTNYSLTPDIEQGLGVRAPLLNPISLQDALYKKFYSAYKNSPDDMSFSGFAQKFYSENGIAEKDQNHLSAIFTKNLANDLASEHLAPEEQVARSRMLASFSDLRTDQINDHSSYLARQAEQNNLFYSPEDSGKYRLRYADSGKTYAIVGSPDEALSAINKIRQSSGLPLDGGYSGPVPPGIANLGNLNDDYNYTASRASQAIDKSRFAGFLSHFAPVYRMLQSGDNIAKGMGLETQFGPTFLKLQEGLINRKNIINRTPALSKLADNMQAALDLGASINSKRRLILADNADAMSINDIKSKFLPRPMSAVEDGMAKEMSKVDVGRAQQLLSDTKYANPNSKVGSDSYLTTLNEVAQKQGVDPSVVKSAHLFAGMINATNPTIFNGDAVLRLASAYESPHLAISQVEHARANNITPKEMKYISMVRDNFRDAASVAGIDPKLEYQMYLPSITRQVASGSVSGIPEGFAREMNRVGITPKNQLIRDPNLLMSKYFVSTVNHLSGFSDNLKEFQDNINAEADKFTGTPGESFVGPLKAQMLDYVNQVQGHKGPGDSMWKSLRDLDSKLGMKSPSINSVMQLMSQASIALRPALAVRDFHNIMSLAYTSFGHEFTQHFLMNSTNPEYVQWMKDNNLLPDAQSKSIRDPMADESDLVAHKFPKLNQASEVTFSLSGQEKAYEHANAAIYQASMKMGEKYFEQLRSGSITKDIAYNKLGLTSNYGPGVISQIDNYLKQGRTDLASDLYGQANMRYLSHVYGFHNNPLGWNTTWGRLLSQWGSWSANASQTAIDQFGRGNKSQIAAKMLRLGTINAATVGIGSALGFNLKSWTVSNPFTVWPNVGPLAGLTSDFSDDFEQGKISVGSELGKLFSGFVPYSKFAEGWVKGLDLVGQGKLLQGLGKGLGAPVSR